MDGGRQITLMGNGLQPRALLLGNKGGRSGKKDEWNRELGCGQGKVKAALESESKPGSKEGSGGGNKKWQFQFPGTYNTDDRGGEETLKKGGWRMRRRRRDTRRDIGASSP